MTIKIGVLGAGQVESFDFESHAGSVSDRIAGTGSEVCLMDIDEKRLDERPIPSAHGWHRSLGSHLHITKTTSREDCLTGEQTVRERQARS